MPLSCYTTSQADGGAAPSLHRRSPTQGYPSASSLSSPLSTPATQPAQASRRGCPSNGTKRPALRPFLTGIPSAAERRPIRVILEDLEAGTDQSWAGAVLAGPRLPTVGAGRGGPGAGEKGSVFAASSRSLKMSGWTSRMSWHMSSPRQLRAPLPHAARHGRAPTGRSRLMGIDSGGRRRRSPASAHYPRQGLPAYA
eukprot:scaffold1312_cov393-Prasinococcus_capsulatus_cf.AAC.12